jgi:phage N-6-adenine-methyltransferase
MIEQQTLFKIQDAVTQDGIDSDNVHFSSSTDEWATPASFFNKCNEQYGPFDLDPCATDENHKCDNYYTRESNGLAHDWVGRVWMNPPYGREIGEWMRKAWIESTRGALVVCLVPSRTDTAWWHDYAAKGEVTFIRGRLKFGGHENPAPFPSALVVFKPNK